MDSEIVNVKEKDEISPKKVIPKKLIIILSLVVLVVIVASIIGSMIYNVKAEESFNQGVNLVNSNSTGDYSDAIAYYKTYINSYPIGKYNKKARELGTLLVNYKNSSDELTQYNAEKDDIKIFNDFITKMEGYVKDIEYSHDLAYDFVFNSNNSVYSEIITFVERNDTTLTNVAQDLNTGRSDLRKYISEEEVSNLKNFLASGYYPSSTIHLCLKLGYPYTDEYKATMSKSWDGYDMLKPQIEEMLKTKKADLEYRQGRVLKLILDLEQLKTKISLAKSDLGDLLERAKNQVEKDVTNSNTSLINSSTALTEKAAVVNNPTAPSDDQLIELIKKGKAAFEKFWYASQDSRQIQSGNDVFVEIPNEYNSPEKLKSYFNEYWSDTMLKKLLAYTKSIDGTLVLPVGDLGNTDFSNIQIKSKNQTGNKLDITISFFAEGEECEWNYSLILTNGSWKIENSPDF